MVSEETECAAAFFRAKGKNVVTPKEFEMAVSLGLKWMSVREASALKAVLLDAKAVVEANGYLKPAEDLSEVQVSIAYRPPEGLMRKVSERSSGAKSRTPKPKEEGAPADMFPEMLDIAIRSGIPKSRFVSESNAVKRRLNIEMVAAALLVLRDEGVDISGLADRVYEQVRSRGRLRSEPRKSPQRSATDTRTEGAWHIVELKREICDKMPGWRNRSHGTSSLLLEGALGSCACPL